MRPEASTTTPLPRRSLPRIRVDGCSRPTVVWMYTTLCKRCLTSSTELSMVGRYLAFTLSGPQMIAEEVGDPAARVREGPRVEADGGAAALVRLVAISHLRQVGARLTDHVEVMVRLRVENDARIRAALSHGVDHRDAGPRDGPVVGVAQQHQERPRHQLVDQRVAPAGIDTHRRPEAGLGEDDASAALTLETRPVDEGDGEHTAVRPPDHADPRAIDVGPAVQPSERADGVVDPFGVGDVRDVREVRCTSLVLPARAPAVDDQRDVPLVAEPARPLVVRLGHAVTTVQQDDGRERPWTLGPLLPRRHRERRAGSRVRKAQALRRLAEHARPGEDRRLRPAAP